MTDRTDIRDDDPRVAAALAAMPTPFRNEDFRTALGIYPFPASEMLVRLRQAGRIMHPGRSQFQWAVRPPA